jgi:hypothetical protein
MKSRPTGASLVGAAPTFAALKPHFEFSPYLCRVNSVAWKSLYKKASLNIGKKGPEVL